MARLLLLLSFLLLTTPAFAGELAGTWLRSGGQADLDARDAAIATAAESFPALLRGIVKKRIGANAIVPERYIIQDLGDRFVMQVDDGPARETDLAGTPIRFIPDGRTDAVLLSRQREGAGVRSTIESAGGGLQSYVERVGERLRVTITITSERLDTPVTYSLHYSAK